MPEYSQRPRHARGGGTQNRQRRGQDDEEFGSNREAQNELRGAGREEEPTIAGTTEWASGMLSSVDESTQFYAISEAYEDQVSQPSVTGDSISSGADYTEAPSLDAIYQGGTIERYMAGPAVAQIQSAVTRLGFEVLTTGLLGEITYEVIKDFQVAYQLQQTGTIDLHDLERLDEALQCSISLEQLKEVAPIVSDANAREWLPFLNASMWEGNINSDSRKSAYVAQLAHESDGFQTLEEYASGAGYEGRADLGNTERGDGVRFKGRGPIQVTGRANYQTYGEQLGVDLINNPALAATPEVGFRIAAAFWANNDLNTLADNGQFDSITQRINGGQNGAADRRAYHRTATASLDNEQDITATSEMSSTVDPQMLIEMVEHLPEAEAEQITRWIQG